MTIAASRPALVAALVLATLAAPPAARGGDLWRDVAVSADDEVARRAYDRAMLDGDEALDLAIAEHVVARRRKYLDRALLAYEAASRARPSAAEPHFRAASALHAFYFECDASPDQPAALCRRPASPQVVKRLLGHWEAFEAKAPLDPRIIDDVLFERAIVFTKLATPDDLARARRDYLAFLDRAPRHRLARLALGNLAETEMMLGDLDASIATYRRVLQIDQRVESTYGLAVALDRDEQGEEARAILRTYGKEGLLTLKSHIDNKDVFYVPAGEEFYYLALGAEAVGLAEDAVRLYDAFLQSGAHPRYAPRAKANRDALAARLKWGK
ncbi:MAG TPA: hypothetical protein VM734_10855 [Kofleriaceae bacterium]|jgi:hypothetical protein|nr:hypothetical protein [Kofleriaceae bacterium]